MKKTFSILLLLTLMLALPACNRDQAPAATPIPTSVAGGMLASATDTSAAAPAASSTDTDAQGTMSTAQSYIGRSVQDLFAAIGQPTESTYGPAKDRENADEGMLFYDGFYVWTLRTETEEVVQEVYADQ